MKKFKYLFTCLMAVLISLACLIDFSDLSKEMPAVAGLDKIAHGAMYFILSAILIWETRGRRKMLPGKDLSQTIYADTRHMYRLFWAVLLLCSLLGGVIEYLQGLTGYRGREAADLTADVMGGLFAYLLYYVTALYTGSSHLPPK